MNIRDQMKNLIKRSEEQAIQHDEYIKMINRVNDLKKSLEMEAKANNTIKEGINAISTEILKKQCDYQVEEDALNNLNNLVEMQVNNIQVEEMKLEKVQQNFYGNVQQFINEIGNNITEDEKIINAKQKKLIIMKEIKRQRNYLMYQKGKLCALENFVNFEENQIEETKKFLDGNI